jgi:hypothetical protein
LKGKSERPLQIGARAVRRGEGVGELTFGIEQSPARVEHLERR